MSGAEAPAYANSPATLQPPMFSMGNNSSKGSVKGSDTVSLTAHYLPSKFATGLLSPGGPRRRKGKGAFDPGLPKQGGGVEAFRSGEARMPGEQDDDYDGVDGSGWFGGKQGKKKLRWNKFKWCLFFANVAVRIVYPFSHLHRLYPNLNIAHHLVSWRPRRMSPHLVQRLGPRRHHPRRQRPRAHPLHRRHLLRHLRRPHRLGWHPPQQPRLPSMVLLPLLDRLRPPPCSRISHLPSPPPQPRRQGQLPVVSRTRRRRPSAHPGPARVLRVLLPLRRSHRQPNVLRPLRATRLQAPVLGLPEDGAEQVLCCDFCGGAVADGDHVGGVVVLEPCDV